MRKTRQAYPIYDFSPKMTRFLGKTPKLLYMSKEIKRLKRNNDGNYEPGNVRWATRKEQANNKRQRKPQTFYAIV